VQLIVAILIISDILDKFNTDNILILNTWLSNVINVFLLGVIIFNVIKVKQFLQYHGAEHKIINAYENKKSITIDEIRKCSRIHYRCGTIYVIFLIICNFIIEQFIQTSIISIKFLLTVGITYEIYKNKFLYKIGFKYLYILGGYIQKYLTTLEPNEKQIEVGIVCLNKLLEESKNC
jgi:uncharacterized protein YqhQ